jgi:proline racemase
MISAVDLHACGEPGRVIVGGVRDVPGRSMFEKMQYLARHQDGLRLRMLREPRGYPAANCNLVLPSSHPGADAGFVIMEQVEYPPMSGTNTICVTTALLETGMIPMKEPVTELTLEAPAGLIRVRAECRDGKVTLVSFTNVPAFAGTGTCAKMATLHARGQLKIGEPFRHEGILGTVFTGTLLEETSVGPYRAVVPELSGTAWITGFAQYVVDPQDPFPEGFTVGDIW